MKIYTTAPLEDPREARTSYRELEEIGYDGAFSFEAKHDPFLPLVLASENTTSLQLGTAIAIAFARTPMTLANAAYGLQSISGGRFIMGLGLSGQAAYPEPLQHDVVEAGEADAGNSDGHEGYFRALGGAGRTRFRR